MDSRSIFLRCVRGPMEGRRFKDDRTGGIVRDWLQVGGIGKSALGIQAIDLSDSSRNHWRDVQEKLLRVEATQPY
jgi:hypothetical protein